MYKPSVALRTILALIGVVALAGCEAQEVTGTAAPASAVAVDNVKPTLSEADAKAAAARLKKMDIACTLVTTLEINVIGIVDDKGAEFGEECDYGKQNGPTPGAKIALSVYTSDWYEQVKKRLTSEGPSLVKTDVIDGVEVFSVQAKPKGCLGTAQRSDGVIVAINIFAPSAAVDCGAVPRLTAQAMKRVPATF